MDSRTDFALRQRLLKSLLAKSYEKLLGDFSGPSSFSSNQNKTAPRWGAVLFGGREWTRTIDLLRVKQVISPAELRAHIGDPNGNRTRVTAVKGRCLNRLTIGPWVSDPIIGEKVVAVSGFEPLTLRV